VYYGADGAQIEKEQLRVRVGLKETEDPILVCYCFGVTERMIQEETQRTGRPSASARIRAEVKKGNCRCEVENPSGRCCLGEVLQAEKRAIAALASGAAPGTPPNSGIVASSAGGLLAAVLASLCCLGPVALGALGVGVGATGLLVDMAGFLKGLVPYRPLFIGITVGLMGMSVYLAYRKPAAKASCPTCVSAQAARGRLLLWIVVGLAVVLVLAPYWLAFVTGE
jgi:mercuric ion transport protein